jgi:predicted oxidoreductase
MSPICTPPFYGVELVPAVTFTTGGGRRDARGRVLDVDGRPIPGLYEAGALGSIFANLFQNGASLAECIVSGRIAGSEAVTRRRPA